MSRAGVLRTFLSVFVFSFLNIANAAKTDVVVLINGDRVTGEVKSLEFGVLSYSTDSMGTVKIDWEDVISLTTEQTLQVEIDSGTRYFGSLYQPNAPGLISVGRSEENIQELSHDSVVRMTQIGVDETFLERVDGDFSIGFDADKGSQVAKTDLTANFNYRTRKYLVGVNANFSLTDQPGADTTQRANIGTNYRRFRSNRWFNEWYANAEKNDQLGLDGRLTAGGALGRYVVQTNRDHLSWLAGVQATKENPADDEASDINGEFRLSMQYLHRAHEPDTNFLWTVDFFPRIDNVSSIRAESDLTFRKEFIKDLFFDITLYYSYITEVPLGAERDDYGVVTSVGYKF